MRKFNVILTKWGENMRLSVPLSLFGIKSWWQAFNEAYVSKKKNNVEQVSLSALWTMCIGEAGAEGYVHGEWKILLPSIFFTKNIVMADFWTFDWKGFPETVFSKDWMQILCQWINPYDISNGLFK